MQIKSPPRGGQCCGLKTLSLIYIHQNTEGTYCLCFGVWGKSSFVLFAPLGYGSNEREKGGQWTCRDSIYMLLVRWLGKLWKKAKGPSSSLGSYLQTRQCLCVVWGVDWQPCKDVVPTSHPSERGQSPSSGMSSHRSRWRESWAQKAENQPLWYCLSWAAVTKHPRQPAFKKLESQVDSHSSGGGSHDQGTSPLGFWGGPLLSCRQLTFCCLLRQQRVQELCGVPFIRALIPFMRAPSMWLSHLSKALPPNNLTWGLRVQPVDFGGMQTSSL